MLHLARRGNDQKRYGDGPIGAASFTGKYRRTRLFVFTLGYSRKSVRLPNNTSYMNASPRVALALVGSHFLGEVWVTGIALEIEAALGDDVRVSWRARSGRCAGAEMGEPPPGRWPGEHASPRPFQAGRPERAEATRKVPGARKAAACRRRRVSTRRYTPPIRRDILISSVAPYSHITRGRPYAR
jgi:hypothetical protein